MRNGTVEEAAGPGLNENVNLLVSSIKLCSGVRNHHLLELKSFTLSKREIFDRILKFCST